MNKLILKYSQLLKIGKFREAEILSAKIIEITSTWNFESRDRIIEALTIAST